MARRFRQRPGSSRWNMFRGGTTFFCGLGFLTSQEGMVARVKYSIRNSMRNLDCNSKASWSKSPFGSRCPSMTK